MDPPSDLEADPLSAEMMERRLAQLVRGPSSRRSATANPFEHALLRAWTDGDPSAQTALRRWIPPDQAAALEEARRRYATVEQVEEASRLLAHVFQVLPKPVLVRMPEGLIWNRAFGAQLDEEARHGSGGRDEAQRRFALLLERGAELRVPRLFVPLGERAWSVHREDFPGATALYLSRVEVDLSSVPIAGRAVALFKASGLAHKQIAGLIDRPKTQVDRLSATHRSAFQQLRAALCHADIA